jgi:beta-lactamase class A
MTKGSARHARTTTPTPRKSHLRVWIFAVGGALIVAVGAIVTFYVSPTSTPVRSSAPSSPSSAPPPTATMVLNPAELAGDFAKFQSGLHAKVGVVVRTVGTGAAGPVSLGGLDFADQPAWSTIKVPLVIASMRQHNASQPTTSMVAAITESDNAAAEALWEGLGDPATAAADVGNVLHDSGDPTTVESRKLRPEYTAFGQTAWSLTNQAKFLAAAACDHRSRPVLDLMGQVTGDQRWGPGITEEPSARKRRARSVSEL